MHYPQKPQELWRTQKAKLKLMFPHLNDEDLRYDYGMKDVMLTQLQAKLGRSRKELESLLEGL